jgi:hypothetical protein
MRTVFLWLLAFVLLPLAAQAADGDNASNFGRPMTLNSVNYAPDTTGIPLGNFDGTCTANLVKASGTMSVNVEGMLTGGGFANMGTLTDTALVTIQGPVEYIRFNVTACSSCLGTAVLRCRVGP